MHLEEEENMGWLKRKTLCEENKQTEVIEKQTEMVKQLIWLLE